MSQANNNPSDHNQSNSSIKVNKSRYGFIDTTTDVPTTKRKKNALNEDRKTDTIMSIYKSKTDSTGIGLAIFNPKIAELVLMNFSDSPSFIRTINQIQVFEPTIIILPDLQTSPQMDKLSYILDANVPATTKKVYEKLKYFNPTDGLNLLKTHSQLNETLFNSEWHGKELSITAAHACVNYCLMFRYHKTANKFRVKSSNCANIMLLDSNTVRDLELVQSIREGGVSFFSFINRCITKMGQKSLRNSILQPMTHKPSIKFRLESVNELISKDDILIAVRTQLKKYQDLERLFASFLEPDNNDQRINDIILLKSTLETTFELANCLSSASTDLLTQIREITTHDHISVILGIIQECIKDDCQWANNSLQLSHQKANAVKEGVNGLLDLSRRIRETILEEVDQLVNHISNEHGLEVEFRHESERGFYLKIKNYRSGLQSLPSFLINKLQKKKVIECTTIELMKQSSKYNDITMEIANLNNAIIEDLYLGMVEFVPILFMISEAVGTLDLLCGFAYFISCQKQSYICPEFGNSVQLTSSRHPILESTIDNFVANNYSCAHEFSRFQIITGPNMSGKSVYLKQFAYITILAQNGCFIPADYAELKIFKGLRTRISCDNSDSNASSFSKEMSEVVSILNNIDEDSLIIIDELGRGSSFTDGFSICLSILEHLITTNAFVFVSTHFREIAEILSNKACVLCSHMQSSEESGNLKMKYNLIPGRLGVTGYGIKFAEHSNLLPQDLIANSKAIADILKSKQSISGNEEVKLLAKRKKLVLELYFALNAMKNLECETEYKVQVLKFLQNKFVQEINKLN